MIPEANEIRELRRDIQDLVVGVDSIGFQLERLVAIERTLATRELGDDPLSAYFEILTGEADPDRSAPPQYAPRGRGREGSAAATIFAAVIIALIAFTFFALYFVGGSMA